MIARTTWLAALARTPLWALALLLSAACSDATAGGGEGGGPGASGTGGDGSGTGGASQGGGGAGDPSATPSWTDGTRLVARVLEAEGGVTVFASFFDTELGIACHFQEGTDGALRCLPNGIDAAFIDEACSLPAVPVGCLGPEAAAVWDRDAECELLVEEAFVPTGELPVPANRFLGDSCVDNGGPTLMAPAERVPLDRFVEGALETVEVAEGIAFQRVVATDGATQITALLRGDAPCEPLLVEGALRCVDVRRHDLDGGHATFFGQADCAGPEHVIASTECGGLLVPSLAERGGTPVCGGTFHALGTPTDQGWEGSGGGCSPVDAPGAIFLPVEDVLPADAFPAFTEAEVGDGRVVLRERRLGGVLPVGDGTRAELHDTLLDVACRPSADAAGVIRCLPRSSGPAAYADAECTVPLFAGDAEEDACDLGFDGRFLLVNELPQCGWTLGAHQHREGGATHVLERGEPYDGPVWDGWEGCEPSTTSQTFHVAGATHPVEDFPVLELR